MKPTSFFHKGVIVASAIGLAALSSACGNLNTGHTSTVSAFGLTSTQVPATPPTGTPGQTTSGLTQGKYTCPSSVIANIKPYNYASFSSGNFQVCVDNTSANDVQMTGDEGSDQICLFPAESSTPIFDQNNLPSYSCGAKSATGLIFTFQASWNSAYVVAGKDVGMMQVCLEYGLGSQFCPAYPNFSYGQFR